MDYIPAKTIITRTPYKYGWFNCDYNMNIYKGCCHGCIYCDSRSECYGVENFQEVRTKQNALNIIERELGSKKKKGIVGTGAMSDPYNPFERELELTRNALKLIDRYRFGVSILTKSDLITRDIDIFQSISARSPVCAMLTVTTFDDALCAKVEPHAPLTSARFTALKKLSKAGIFTGVLIMPVLPFINDTEENIRSIVNTAAGCGVRFVFPAFGVTLRQNQRDYFYRELDIRFPGIKQKYVQAFGNRYQCASPLESELQRVLQSLCRKHGLFHSMQDIIGAYCCPEKKQISMFE